MGWRTSVRLPRDHYVRLDSNDYSVDPAAVGRRVEVAADLRPGHGDLRRAGGRRPCPLLGQASDASPTRAHAQPPSATAPPTGARPRQPAPSRVVEQRSLADYDAAFGLETEVGVMATKTTATAGRDVTAELAFLTRALKAPTLRDAVDRLAERARAESWTHEEFLAACLQREVSARDSPTAARAASAPPGSRPARALEEFDFDHARGLKRELDRPPRHPGLRHRQRQRAAARTARHRQDPPRHRAGDPRLPSRPPGPVRDRRRMGHPPRRRPPRRPAAGRAAPASAATRCSSSTRSATSPSNPKRRTCSSSSSPPATNGPRLIVTSNKPFGRWGEVFGDEVVAAAMIDRLVHHAEVIALKGDSYRLKDRDLGRTPTPTDED